MKGKGSLSILGCPKLDEVLYVNGLKASLLSISQICDKDHKVNFFQDLCKIVNKEGKVIVTRHRIVDNCYAINLIFRTPLVCSRTKVDPIELWHRRLSRINNRDLVHLVNSEKVRGIPRLSDECKPICGECMNGKQTKSSHKKVNQIRTTKPLYLIYMDLMGLIRTK